MSAFVPPSFTSAFTPARGQPATASRRPSASRPARFVMADEKQPFFRNPFAAKPAQPAQPDAPSTTFIAPQPGDPGYKEPAAAKPPQQPTPLPVVADDKGAIKRGLDLLKQDVLKNAPEQVGVGRQDSSAVTMRPQAGEPGYKPAAYQTVRVSKLGISTFSDDKNYLGNVGGIDAVKKAALEVVSGEKTTKQLKAEALSKVAKTAPKKETTVYDIPDYLKPLPEDTPRKGMTWKNW
ncbi:hypothetical protein BWQ96_04155 [Gracilariopsis chorda]|uniref:Uncharacterized protein n=1 Tax=Gracilariopsis chorda TaxID=448386 RepID=A0A2V3IVN3_9FLOR|nr:hypothetical protein BWQ96_04155 [Gracilariopsis chorda]|eukprot:PXF46149.1 hypothetical protein BWQ96_04155 [Gracilariopsis chorda]